ncbi:hypothetical protein D3C80_2219780 [compost metagenome]
MFRRQLHQLHHFQLLRHPLCYYLHRRQNLRYMRFPLHFDLPLLLFLHPVLPRQFVFQLRYFP